MRRTVTGIGDLLKGELVAVYQWAQGILAKTGSVEATVVSSDRSGDKAATSASIAADKKARSVQSDRQDKSNMSGSNARGSERSGNSNAGNGTAGQHQLPSGHRGIANLDTDCFVNSSIQVPHGVLPDI